MKNLAFIFILISAANVGLAQGQANRAETLYNLGVESAGKAGYTSDFETDVGYLEAAIKHLTKALKIEPRNVKILLKRAEIHLQLHEFEKAVADCEKALQNTPLNRKSQRTRAFIYHLLGKIYERGFYLAKAVDAHTTALKFDLKNAEIYQSRGFLYQFVGEAGKADADFSKAESLSRANEKSGGTLIATIEESVSTSAAKKPLIEIPEVFQVCHFKEVGDYYDGFFGEAASKEEEQKTYRSEIEKAKKIVNFNPKSELALWKLTNLYLRAGEFDEAVKGFMALVLINKRYEYLNNMGVALAEKGKLRNAIIQFEIAIRNGNTRIEAFYNRGLSYLKINENENAVADFTEVIKLDPNFNLAYKSRAKAFRALGKIAEAEADETTLKRLGRK